MTGFARDQVENWTPVSFAMAFTRKLRKHKAVSHIPSLRTSLAIPRFLTARYFRTRLLTPHDYTEAAVLNTVPEDQSIAEQVAHDLLFPKAEKEKKKSRTEKSESEPEPAGTPADPTLAILGDIESLDIDFDNIDDLSSLDQILADDEQAMGAFELFEDLYSSADETERSLAELSVLFGGPAELEVWGIRTVPRIQDYIREMLRENIGNLTPDHIYHGCKAGFSTMLLQETRKPWELAGAMAGAGDVQGLEKHMEDLLENGVARELGRTMQFLQPCMDMIEPGIFDDFAEQAMGKARDLSEFGELVAGLGKWTDPPGELLETSARENIQRALNAASWLEKGFGVSLAEDLFNHWAHSLEDPPTLDMLINAAVDCPAWRSMIKKAFDSYVKWLRKQTSAPLCPRDSNRLVPINKDLYDTVSTADSLVRTGTSTGGNLACVLATEALCLINHKDHFLPMLDEFIEHGIIPFNVSQVVKAGISLGVDPHEIYDRLGNAVDQLKQMISADICNATRYKHLVEKINDMDYETVRTLTQTACKNKNQEAMAAMLGINMGFACMHAPEDFVMASLCYKGIGGGTNLLRQWFTHCHDIASPLKEQIKSVAKEALIELSFEWINKGSGSGEGGLIPQNRARPFMAGDDLDMIDIESTLDAIITSGKNLESITGEELFVYDTSKGRAALGVLIDISGSMSGQELAICAIAVVMLLGRVRSEEVAIAVFESDTHVIKGFHDPTDLDQVADHILDLTATGGTCADAALEWVRAQYTTVPEVEFRLLFLLSDFCFFESPQQLHKLGTGLADLGVVFLGASHGYVCKQELGLLREAMTGHSIELKSIQQLPAILIETLEQIGEEQLR
ncbi:MAG: VWA domain-containing protein [Desulfobacteraceae bacterium]|nr:VWA domain-containing protein [Desulfobacteraceae bacterium]